MSGGETNVAIIQLLKYTAFLYVIIHLILTTLNTTKFKNKKG